MVVEAHGRAPLPNGRFNPHPSRRTGATPYNGTNFNKMPPKC